MPSYKIHSLKDNKKLSFIIEWDSDSSVEQKLSGEGHIVLSVEEIQLDQGIQFFSFEGRKPADNSFISGKISAENIFTAYEMLTRDYNYGLSRLYPSEIENPAEQEKIFQQLLFSFQEKKVEKKVEKADSSQWKIQKNKKNIQALITYIETEKTLSDSEVVIQELKKLDQINNNSIIEETLRSTIKKIYKNTSNKQKIHPTIKAIANDLHIFLIPPLYRRLGQKTQEIFEFFSPLIHPSDSTYSPKEIKKEVTHDTIQKDPHINKLLHQKYHSSLINLLDIRERQAYFYALFRQKPTIFLGKKSSTILQKILHTTLVVFILGMCILALLGKYNLFFFSTEIFVMFVILLFSSLVFLDQTV